MLRGELPDAVLDTYQSERHPVAARVLHNTRAQAALGRPGPHADALRDVVADLITFPEVNDRLAGMISALDVRYEMPGGGDHPLVGRRMPDLDLAGGHRVYELLHRARPVHLALAGATADPPAESVLIRPDGYVAWAGAGNVPEPVLAAWCGTSRM